jgi:two-component system, sensor histidine kinase
MNLNKSSQAIPRRGASLVVRFSATASVVVVVAMAVLGWFNFQGAKQHLSETWMRTLEHERRTVALKCEAVAADVARDVSYLARSQSVLDFLQEKNAVTRSRAEQDFRALMGGKPSYMQVRIIAADGDGMELLRVDRIAAEAVAMPVERLQPKGDRDYVRDGMKLKDGDVYLSDIDLNRDFGGISQPFTPTMRAVAVAIGAMRGLVVINVDLTDFLAELPTQRAASTRLYVANDSGSWLVHPRAEARFGGDLGNSWSADRPSINDVTEFENDRVFSQGRHQLHGGPQRRSVFIRAASVGGLELDGLRAARNKALAISSTAAAAGILLLVALARWTTRRLREVAEAIGNFDAGQTPKLLPETLRDEVGLVAAGFNAMSQKIARQVAAVEAARADAVEAAKAKEQFLAVMSHEIRTPLNAVTGLLRLLERNKPQPHQLPVLRSLNAAASQLTALFNGVLDWSKLRAGRMEVQVEAFPLRRLLEDIAMVHRPLAVQKGLTFRAAIAETVPEFAMGDATRLAQILHNLLNNALKFTKEGGISLETEWAFGRLKLDVSDTGIGVAEEDRERIFSPFDQAADSAQFGGTGLGLSITKSLVEIQGGSIRVGAGENNGAQFTVELPCEPAPAQAEREGEAIARLPGNRILYVEDTASNREVMRALIDETGAILDVAETAAEALLKLREHKYDVALFDLQLPDMSGIELAKMALAICPELPIFAVTAQLSDDSRVECLRVGMRGAIAKPIVPALLFELLDSAQSPRLAATTPLHALFKGEHLARVLLAISDELQKAKLEIAKAVDSRDGDALRKTRHRLHSAIVQMDLTGVDSQLARLLSGDWDALADCLSALEVACANCRREASAQHRQSAE